MGRARFKHYNTNSSEICGKSSNLVEIPLVLEVEKPNEKPRKRIKITVQFLQIGSLDFIL